MRIISATFKPPFKTLLRLTVNSQSNIKNHFPKHIHISPQPSNQNLSNQSMRTVRYMAISGNLYITKTNTLNNPLVDMIRAEYRYSALLVQRLLRNPELMNITKL